MRENINGKLRSIKAIDIGVDTHPPKRGLAPSEPDAIITGEGVDLKDSCPRNLGISDTEIVDAPNLSLQRPRANEAAVSPAYDSQMLHLRASESKSRGVGVFIRDKILKEMASSFS